MPSSRHREPWRGQPRAPHATGADGAAPSRGTRGTRWCATALLVALAACARLPPPLPAPPGDPLAVARQRVAAVRTLRAQFDAVARFPGGERRSTGVLLVRAPGDWRLRLVGPFGLTVLDAVRAAGRTTVTAPLGDGGRDGTAFTRLGPGDSLVFGADGGWPPCRPAAAPDGGGEYWCGSPPTRWVSVDPATATVRAEAALEDGRPVVTRSYGDYRLVDGVPLPFRIRIEYPVEQVTVEIAISRYELNPPLRDEQFQPPAAEAS